jgi:hypothetical protein
VNAVIVRAPLACLQYGAAARPFRDYPKNPPKALPRNLPKKTCQVLASRPRQRKDQT